jgi:hypothetical protein
MSDRCADCKGVELSWEVVTAGLCQQCIIRYPIAGTMYHERFGIIEDRVQPGDLLTLTHDYNHHDPRAISVNTAAGEEIGFVPQSTKKDMLTQVMDPRFFPDASGWDSGWELVETLFEIMAPTTWDETYIVSTFRRDISKALEEEDANAPGNCY